MIIARIPKMKMPESCAECRIADVSNIKECPYFPIEKADYAEERYEYCPLEECEEE